MGEQAPYWHGVAGGVRALPGYDPRDRGHGESAG